MSRISVVMPVCNADIGFLSTTMDSILNQIHFGFDSSSCLELCEAKNIIQNFALRGVNNNQWALAILKKAIGKKYRKTNSLCKQIWYLIISNDCDQIMREEDQLMNLTEGGKLNSYKYTGFLYAMDTPEDKEDINKIWSKNEALWKIWK